MNFNSKNKKFGFTLMEVLIAVFIVAILTMITVPIVTRQLEKSEEYSYYLAYKTVEKMAGQIMAIGDPSEIALGVSDTKISKEANDSLLSRLSAKNIKLFFTSLGQKFAYSEEYLFRKVFPKSFATETITLHESAGEWDSDSFDYLWLGYKVCTEPNGESTYLKSSESVTNADGSTALNNTYYKKSDFDNCVGFNASDANVNQNDNMKEDLYIDACNTSALSTDLITLKSGDKPNAKNFCESVTKPRCAVSADGGNSVYSVVFVADDGSEESADNMGDDDADAEPDDAGDDEHSVETPSSEVAGKCVISVTKTITVDNDGSSSSVTAKPSFPESYCDAHNYYHMTNRAATESVDCVCRSGFIPSNNDDRACCSPCSGDGASPYAYRNLNGVSFGCVCCSTDYNSVKGQCCPENSVYNGGDTCTCIEGYDMNSTGTACVKNEYCTPGSTFKDGVCVINPPVRKAAKFCELVAENWNINSSYCSGFTNSNGMSYSQDVYNAAKGNNNGNFLSIDAQTGAFNNIRPNIVFSNGLKMWILSDKQASITGLTNTTVGVTPTTNVCKNLNKHNAAACANSDGFFCKSENNCFTLDNPSLAFMKDARNCCGSVDLSDLAVKTQTDPGYTKEDYLKDSKSYAISGFTVFVDINGDKGEGTLWDDVYPFFIGSNGVVYPGYPLDAPKSANSGSNALYLGGNSEKQLPVDVYYYESTNETREKKVAFANVSYARGVCSARKISKYTPYCMNLGDKFYSNSAGNTAISGSNYIEDDNKDTSINPCDNNNCFVSVRRKLKSF